jgi:hypothetical protein
MTTRILVVASVVFGIFLGVIIAPSVYSYFRLAAAMPADDDAGWASKVGWRLCNGAIAAWPGKPAPACWKLAICDNEGDLNMLERKRLEQMLKGAACDP